MDQDSPLSGWFVSGGVPPSSRAGKRPRYSASDPVVKRAASLYERFTGHTADEGHVVDVPDMPRVIVNIGDIDGLLYTTVRDGVVESYIHKFHKNDKPVFGVSPDGKRLFLIGGRFDFTERGIVDKSDRSR